MKDDEHACRRRAQKCWDLASKMREPKFGEMMWKLGDFWWAAAEEQQRRETELGS
jgi:hypothetical protein